MNTLTCFEDVEEDEDPFILALTLRAPLNPLLNNTAPFPPEPSPAAAPGDTVARLFFWKSPIMEAISGLTCDPPPDGKSDIWKLRRGGRDWLN